MSEDYIESFDPAMDFENLIPKFLGQQDLSIYLSNYWKQRNAILYTICFSQYYTKLHSSEINDKLYSLMESVINEDDDKIKIAVECMEFLKKIPNKSTNNQ